MQNVKIKMNPEQVRELQELRRSSASSKHRNKTKYRRTDFKNKRNRYDV